MVAVELRNRNWVVGEQRKETLAFFKHRKIPLVSVDAPSEKHFMIMPSEDYVTGDLAYLRCHGRNAEGYIKGRSVAARFNYLYNTQEVKDLASLEAEMNDRGIQSEGDLWKIQIFCRLVIQSSSPSDQNFSHGSKYPPVPMLVRVSEVCAGEPTPKAQMILELWPSPETSNDVPQTLSIGQLPKTERQELIIGRKCPGRTRHGILFNTPRETLGCKPLKTWEKTGLESHPPPHGSSRSMIQPLFLTSDPCLTEQQLAPRVRFLRCGETPSSPDTQARSKR